jgi:indole-3-glycerol phosphate synthase
MGEILRKIVATKREEIAQAKLMRGEDELRAAVADAPPVRSFFDALAHGSSIRLIAEVKKASPSKGVIRADFDPLRIATLYEQAGAHCISVLTDENYFQGSLEYLRAIRQQVAIPLLRKDFILDTYQLLEARVAGADAVLLIAECLDDCHLRKLHNEAIELGMTPLVEFYDPENLARVLQAGATLIGVNIVICGRSTWIWIIRCECEPKCPKTACWSAKAGSTRAPTLCVYKTPVLMPCWSGKV